MKRRNPLSKFSADQLYLAILKAGQIRDFIQIDLEIVVDEDRQYIVHDRLIVDGTIVLDGKLVVI